MMKKILMLSACVLLAVMPALSGAEDIVSFFESGPVDVSAVTGGTLTERRFEARNGTVVNYCLYLPNVEDPAEKQPILVHFHGYKDTMEYHHGIGELIRTGEVRPKGIVILLQAVKETGNSEFHEDEYQDAVVELLYATAEKYNGDIDRLSVSGHSEGGTVAYEIVNRYPGVFAACATIASAGTMGEGVKLTNLWAFQGDRDIWVKASSGLRVAKKCKAAGCNAMYYLYRGKGHEIQTMVFQDTFTDENGNEVKLIDWLMSKENPARAAGETGDAAGK